MRESLEGISSMAEARTTEMGTVNHLRLDGTKEIGMEPRIRLVSKTKGIGPELHINLTQIKTKGIGRKYKPRELESKPRKLESRGMEPGQLEWGTKSGRMEPGQLEWRLEPWRRKLESGMEWKLGLER